MLLQSWAGTPSASASPAPSLLYPEDVAYKPVRSGGKVSWAQHIEQQTAIKERNVDDEDELTEDEEKEKKPDGEEEEEEAEEAPKKKQRGRKAGTKGGPRAKAAPRAKAGPKAKAKKTKQSKAKATSKSTSEPKTRSRRAAAKSKIVPVTEEADETDDTNVSSSVANPSQPQVKPGVFADGDVSLLMSHNQPETRGKKRKLTGVTPLQGQQRT